MLISVFVIQTVHEIPSVLLFLFFGQLMDGFPADVSCSSFWGPVFHCFLNTAVQGHVVMLLLHVMHSFRAFQRNADSVHVVLGFFEGRLQNNSDLLKLPPTTLLQRMTESPGVLVVVFFLCFCCWTMQNITKCNEQTGNHCFDNFIIRR